MLPGPIKKCRFSFQKWGLGAPFFPAGAAIPPLVCIPPNFLLSLSAGLVSAAFVALLSVMWGVGDKMVPIPGKWMDQYVWDILQELEEKIKCTFGNMSGV